MIRTLSALLACMLLPVLPGCISPTYVNIPPLPSDTAFNSPNTRNIHAISEAALEAIARLDAPITAVPYEFILAAESSPESYAAVAERLGPDALIPGDEPVPGTLTYEVRQIAVRVGEARVDVVRERDNGRWEMVEVQLKLVPVSGWVVEYTRPRRIAVTPPVRPDLELLPDVIPAPPTPPASASDPTTQPAPPITTQPAT
ncbi:MAG: hypothetical protein AAF750_15055 [Planctomycetota bacterium]